MASIKIDVTVNKGRVIGISQGIRGLQGADTLESAINADRAEAARIGAEAAETVAVSSKDITVSNAAITNSDVVTTNADALQTGLDRIATAADVVTISNAETNTSADAVQTALDRVATGEDVVTTNADAISTSVDAAQTALDRIATGEDRVATNQDATNTALDLVATNQDTIDTAADRVQTTADAASANASKLAAAASASDSADSAALAATYAAATTHGLVMMGQWDASGGTAPPTPPNDPNDAAHNYIISVAGTILTTDYEVDDEIIWDSVNNVWFKRDNTERMKSVNGMTGNVNVTPTTIGLDQIDNTSDINKPISSATQTALDNKANTSGTYAGLRAQATTKDDVGLGNVDNTSDQNKPISDATQAVLDTLLASGVGSLSGVEIPNVDAFDIPVGIHAVGFSSTGDKPTTSGSLIQGAYDPRTLACMQLWSSANASGLFYRLGNAPSTWGQWYNLLDERAGDTASSANTIVKRDVNKTIFADYINLAHATSPLSGNTVEAVLVDIGNGHAYKKDIDSFRQVDMAPNWVLKWGSGDTDSVTNSWGNGTFLIKFKAGNFLAIVEVTGETGYMTGICEYATDRLLVARHLASTFTSHGIKPSTGGNLNENMEYIWKAE